jgi:N-acetylglucosaminyldiphosphoundecaprenol N-acetyl-beta-D-mannosaminyltransferase
MSCGRLAAFAFKRKRMLRSEVPRANVLGVGVSAINMSEALSLFQSWLGNGGKGYVCVTGVHGVMEAQNDPEFRRILNKSLLTTPDGMPTVWVGKLQGFQSMGRVFGPDLMREVCRLSVENGYSHFFYGGRPGIAEKLKAAMTQRFPGLRVAGTYTPPFGSLSCEEEAHLLSLVAKSKPDIFWVGLSTPKQERFMAEYNEKIQTKIMVGVGAAFDLHTGSIKDAPDWVKSSGLQWMHRLVQDPRRLWKRYLLNNPKFLWKISLQLAHLSKHSLD